MFLIFSEGIKLFYKLFLWNQTHAGDHEVGVRALRERASKSGQNNKGLPKTIKSDQDQSGFGRWVGRGKKGVATW